MLIPAIGSVNKIASIASVNSTRNVSSPSFGYGVEGHEYEHAAMRALEDHVKMIKVKLGKTHELSSLEEGILAFKDEMSERMMRCFDGSQPKEDSDQLMDTLVRAAEKLGLISKDSYKPSNGAVPQASPKILDFVV